MTLGYVTNCHRLDGEVFESVLTGRDARFNKLVKTAMGPRSAEDSFELALSEALEHLSSVDPVMYKLAHSIRLENYLSDSSPFESLVHAVIYQQLSGRSASSVFSRFLKLYGGTFPTPEQLLSTPEKLLRGAGLSFRKAEYLKEVARAATSMKLESGYLRSLPDEDVVQALDSIKGVGRWTVHMLLIFVLGRLDVFPSLDLGLRKAIARLYRLSEIPSEREADLFANRWKPYRSVASILLWRSSDTTPWG